MQITAVTTTRGRPWCFGLLEKYVARSLVKPDQWIVVNDGEPYDYTMGQEVVARDPSQDTLPSICENWLAALPLIRGDVVVILEDDDWFAPDYVGTMAGYLKDYDLAGLAPAVYYHVPSLRWAGMGNGDHASLACTAFTRAALPQVERCCKVFKSVYIDMYLWAEWGTPMCAVQGRKSVLMPNARGNGLRHVGLKGLPGAKGLGQGHQPAGFHDPGGVRLQEWLGADADPYLSLDLATLSLC